MQSKKGISENEFYNGGVLRTKKWKTVSLQAADTLLSIDKQFYIWSVVSSDPVNFQLYMILLELCWETDSAVFDSIQVILLQLKTLLLLCS